MFFLHGVESYFFVACCNLFYNTFFFKKFEGIIDSCKRDIGVSESHEFHDNFVGRVFIEAYKSFEDEGSLRGYFKSMIHKYFRSSNIGHSIIIFGLVLTKLIKFFRIFIF